MLIAQISDMHVKAEGKLLFPPHRHGRLPSSARWRM